MQLNPSAEKLTMWKFGYAATRWWQILWVLCCCNLKVFFFFLIILNKNSKVISLNNILLRSLNTKQSRLSHYGDNGVGISKPNVCAHLFILVISEEPQEHNRNLQISVIMCTFYLVLRYEAF